MKQTVVVIYAMMIHKFVNMKQVVLHIIAMLVIPNHLCSKQSVNTEVDLRNTGSDESLETVLLALKTCVLYCMLKRITQQTT